MPAYTDPLFGIALLVAIIAVGALLDYLRHHYHNRKKARSLATLTKSYEFLGLKDGVEEFLALSHNPIPTLQFIAQAYMQSGNTQEAIKIYLSILENLKRISTPSKEQSQAKIDILQSLGKAYFDAGFLQRAKDIFLEILKNYPKNPQVLTYLLKTYENLGEYKHAIDALECIEEIYDSQGAQGHLSRTIALNKAYLCTLLLIAAHDVNLETKIKQLQDIKNKEPKCEKIILNFFKSINHTLFWEEVSHAHNIANLVDILWQFEEEQVPFGHIQNKAICDVYRAKGFILDDESCQVFELENMRILKRYCTFSVDFAFEYRCHSCKHIVPFENARCSHCGELLNSDTIYKIRKCDNEASYPLL